jgi:hypothetical protein
MLMVMPGTAGRRKVASLQGDFIFEKCCTISFNLKKPGSP